MRTSEAASASRSEGERRRDEAIGLLHASRADLIRRVQRAFLRWLLDHGPATIDPVRDLVRLPAGIDPRLVGAAVKALVDAGIIRGVGRAKSARPEAHGRKLDVWAVSSHAAAEEWLARHPAAAGEAAPAAAMQPSLFD